MVHSYTNTAMCVPPGQRDVVDNQGGGGTCPDSSRPARRSQIHRKNQHLLRECQRCIQFLGFHRSRSPRVRPTGFEAVTGIEIPVSYGPECVGWPELDGRRRRRTRTQRMAAHFRRHHHRTAPRIVEGFVIRNSRYAHTGCVEHPVQLDLRSKAVAWSLRDADVERLRPTVDAIDLSRGSGTSSLEGKPDPRAEDPNKQVFQGAEVDIWLSHVCAYLAGPISQKPNSTNASSAWVISKPWSSSSATLPHSKAPRNVIFRSYESLSVTPYEGSVNDPRSH